VRSHDPRDTRPGNLTTYMHTHAHVGTSWNDSHTQHTHTVRPAMRSKRARRRMDRCRWSCMEEPAERTAETPVVQCVVRIGGGDRVSPAGGCIPRLPLGPKWPCCQLDHRISNISSRDEAFMCVRRRSMPLGLFRPMRSRFPQHW
jgi:hypothetical protein